MDLEIEKEIMMEYHSSSIEEFEESFVIMSRDELNLVDFSNDYLDEDNLFEKDITTVLRIDNSKEPKCLLNYDLSSISKINCEIFDMNIDLADDEKNDFENSNNELGTHIKRNFFLRYKNVLLPFSRFPLMLFSAINSGYITEVEQIINSVYEKNCKLEWELINRSTFTNFSSKSLFEFYRAYINAVPDMAVKCKNIKSYVGNSHTILKWKTITTETFVNLLYFGNYFRDSFQAHVSLLKQIYSKRWRIFTF